MSRYLYSQFDKLVISCFTDRKGGKRGHGQIAEVITLQTNYETKYSVAMGKVVSMCFCSNGSFKVYTQMDMRNLDILSWEENRS